MDADAIVVGGGPAGSATATLLAARGHDVLLLDRARFPRPKACAEYLSPGTEDVLARLGALPAVRALRPERPLGMRLIQDSGVIATIAYRGGADDASVRRALCVTRERFDAVLLEHARGNGARVLEATEVRDVAVGRDGVRVGVRRGEEAEALRARVVIGADGARSAVARGLGVTRRVAWPRRLGLVAHFTRTELTANLSEWGEMHVSRGAYCGLAPLPDGLLNVGMVLPLDAGRAGGGARAALAEGLRRVPAAAARLRGAVQVGPLRGAAPVGARVHRTAGDRFILVGDAAGFLDPFTGEGVFRALRGAELAAETLDGALRRDDLSQRALASYEAERRREFGQKEVVSWMVQGLLAAPRLLGYALRRLEGRPRHAALLGRVLGDYHPAADALRPGFLLGLLRP
ncbi:MAG TPA: NAD(P)/FAD-dependent oxidoreductase [Chloroflexota bacterium]|nr:NAD(P)/FAD-dependent oxidoreductase [Chloroflexota bacterium]